MADNTRKSYTHGLSNEWSTGQPVIPFYSTAFIAGGVLITALGLRQGGWVLVGSSLGGSQILSGPYLVNQKVEEASTSAAAPSQEFVVRVPKDVKKKYGVMKFNPNNKVDFTKCDGAKIERENNLRDYKAVHNLETMPQFGAGSEYGRNLREEARLKKLGIYRKSYKVEDQPWKLKLGTGKSTRHFKGNKEGGVQENASYYIFTQCPDGAFEAFPVDEFHNFNPAIRYKHLTAEEAEEQYTKREQIMNYHSIMVQKRFRDDKVDSKEDGDEKKAEKTKKGKDFLLTDLDDWAILSDDSQGEGHDSDDDQPREKQKKKTKVLKKSGNKHNSDDEAVEESDEEDEGREVDYMTDTDSEDEDMYANKDREGKDKYQVKGVEDEEALQKLIESDEDNEVEKPKEEDDEDAEAKDKASDKKGSDSDSDSSSGSASDPEKDGSFTSALFMPKKESQEKKKDKKQKSDKEEKKNKGKSLKRKGSFSSEGSAASNSRCATPTATADTVSKKESETSPLAKKTRTEATTPTPGAAGNEGLSEETVRRYLMRKPMTTRDLLHKFKSCGLPKEKLVFNVAEILKKINPEKNVVKDKLYLSIKH